MVEAALFGGSDACLTAYTIAQLDALRIYAQGGIPWPCRPLFGALQPDTAPPINRVILGEGAGTALLVSEDAGGFPSNACGSDLELLGVGWALEEIATPTGISSDGVAFESAMRMALKEASSGEPVEIVSVIMHAPGSQRGDGAELDAVRRVLGSVPVYSTKHLTGHTYGASGMISLALATAMLNGVDIPPLPYLSGEATELCKGFRIRPSLGSRRGVLINTAGFGGNAISVLVGC
jgi:3-oxoacyl-(acyl-carrier-protein) synthase